MNPSFVVGSPFIGPSPETRNRNASNPQVYSFVGREEKLAGASERRVGFLQVQANSLGRRHPERRAASEDPIESG
jgi:hypothetical protein